MVGRRRSASPASREDVAWRALAQAQAGVISRRQLLELGLTEGAVSSRLDSCRWTGLLPGVYATFTGPVPPLARAWAAVLYASASSVAGEVVDVIDQRSRPEPVIDLVLRATQRRLTTPARLRAALKTRSRHR